MRTWRGRKKMFGKREYVRGRFIGTRGEVGKCQKGRGEGAGTSERQQTWTRTRSMCQTDGQTDT